MMAAKPIERFIKRQIADQGGWERILERIGSGETISAIAKTFLRPDGVSISFAFFSRLLHQDPNRKPLIAEAKRIRAEAWADEALARVDGVLPDRDHIAKARVLADVRLRLAALADREGYGERKAGVELTVNVGQLHLSALRHRELPTNVSVPLPVAAGQATVSGAVAMVNGSPVETEVVQSLAPVETVENHSQLGTGQ